MRIEKQKHHYEKEKKREIPDELKYSEVSFGLTETAECFQCQQRCTIERYERIGSNCVQAFINNISFPTTLEELLYTSDYLSSVDELLHSTENEWTVPKWAKAGDIVFFMHSKTARSIITRLRTELSSAAEDFSPEDCRRMTAAIEHGLETHTAYGGKIFAIGRVSGGPEYVDDEEISSLYHWSSHHFAEIDNIVQLENPVDISQFNSFITVTRGGAITPVWGNEFENLKEVISRTNNLPWFVKESSSKPLPLRKITPHNWISVANDYRRCFILENQFRSFYVDYLLKSIGDRKQLYSECRCTKSGINPSFIDNVLLFAGKYLAVEVKLSVPAETNIKAQVNKYCFNSIVYLDTDGKTITCDDMHPGKVLVIDTEWIYMYDAMTDGIESIFELDQLRSWDDLPQLKNTIKEALKSF